MFSNNVYKYVVDYMKACRIFSWRQNDEYGLARDKLMSMVQSDRFPSESIIIRHA